MRGRIEEFPSAVGNKKINNRAKKRTAAMLEIFRK